MYLINMCGRYVCSSPMGRYADALGLTLQVGDILPRYNIAPGDSVPVVHLRLGGLAFEHIFWGFTPGWANAQGARVRGKRIQPINATAETIDTNGMYKSAFKHTPCVFLMDGFYEPDKRGRAPHPQYYYCRADQGPLWVAGIYAHWKQAPEDSLYLSAALITVPANATVAGHGHDRMPAILDDAEAVKHYLDPALTVEQRIACLQPLLDGLLDVWLIDRNKLNRRVDKSRWYDGPDIVEPIEPAP